MNRENAVIMAKTLIGSGIKSEYMHIGIMCVIAKECGFELKRESGYRNTSTSRIRKIFPTRMKKLTDDEIDVLKKDDVSFFNHVYNGKLGNRRGTNDGYDFRGGGFPHFTGRGMYTRYNPEFSADPRMLALSPTVSAHGTVAYFNTGLIKSALLRARYGKLNSYNTGIRWAANINAGLGNGKNSAVVKRAVGNATKHLDEVLEIYNSVLGVTNAE